MTRRTNPLSLPDDVLNHLTADIAIYGTQKLETGAFLLAPAGAPNWLAVLALAGTQGITRRPDHFSVTGEALEQLFEWAEDHHLRVRAQVHSHSGPAFLSRTDRTHGLNVPGFTTTVVPSYTDPPRTVAGWGWWRHEDGDWRTVPPAVVGAHPASIVRFDMGGVRDA
jgi:proteasome lid subunit RPN8/RPN11